MGGALIFEFAAELLRCAVRVGLLLVAVAGLFAGLRADAATADEWVARSWQTEDGLPQNTVSALVQTRDGFLWVGTYGGLARFDGVRFHTFGLRDGLRSVRVSALTEDQQGALWVGTGGGSLSRWENGRFTTFGEAEGFPTGGDIVSMAADRDGSIWIGTTEGLVKWSSGTFTKIGDAQGLPRTQIRALLSDSKGTLWVSVIEKGLFCGNNGEFVRVGEPGPTRGDVYSLMEDQDGSIWVGAGNGQVWRGRDGAWKQYDSTNGLPIASTVSLTQGRDGTLWLGMGNGGLYRLAGERFEQAAGEGELSDQNVRGVMTDRQESIWVGTSSGGLNRLSRRVLRYWSADAGLGKASVSSVAEDASGALWVGTGANGIWRFESGRFSKLEDPGVPDKYPNIYSTATTNDGSIWAAGEQCLFRFQAGQPTKALLDPPVRGESLRALCADGDTLWAGTYYGTLLRCDASGVQVAVPRGTFPADLTSIAREAAETLWIGTSGGLYRWERGKVQSWGTRDGLLTASIRALHRDADGTLWLGTLGGGLARMKDGKFIHFTTREGLIDDVISQIVPDDFGYLWLGCNRGIMRVGRRELETFADGKISELHPIIFGRNEGMLKEQCTGGHSPTALKTKDGRLLFPTMNGMAEIDPQRLQNLPTTAPQASIEAVLVDSQPRPLDKSLVIPPGNHRLAVSFTAPVLRGGEWVRFRHRLEGLDKDWINAGSNRVASYDGLRPDRYVFHVAAADSQGRWNEASTTLAFKVQPLFWQTAWFRLAVAFLVVGLNGGAVWWRAHLRYRRHLAEVERERLHQAQLSHVGRVALLGELSASLAHELKQPLAAILSNAQAGLRFLKNDPSDVEEVRAILTDIASSDRRASEIIGRMRAMMKKGEAQLDARDINADIEQVLELMHSDLQSRNVTIILRLAPDLPLVRADHIQVQQVLLNLIVNGCDAMHDNPPSERRLVVETAHDGTELIRVSIVDRGAGIAPEMLERIFEPFYSTKSHGLGMGLSICRAIILAHGGQLRAANNPDRGATLHFTLTVGEKKQA